MPMKQIIFIIAYILSCLFVTAQPEGAAFPGGDNIYKCRNSRHFGIVADTRAEGYMFATQGYWPDKLGRYHNT